MDNRILCSTNVLEQIITTKNKVIFAIPVIKLDLYISKSKSTFDIFETGILELLLCNDIFLNHEDIADILKLDSELTLYILKKFKHEKIIDENHIVSKDVIDQLFSQKRQTESMRLEIYYDLVQNKIVSEQQSVLIDTTKESSKNKLTLSTETKEITLSFSYLKSKDQIDTDDISKKVIDTLFKRHMDFKFIDVLYVSRKQYLLTVGKFNKNRTNYNISNPIDDSSYQIPLEYIQKEIDELYKNNDDMDDKKYENDKYFKTLNEICFDKPIPPDLKRVTHLMYNFSKKNIRECILGLSDCYEMLISKYINTNFSKLDTEINELGDSSISCSETILLKSKRIGFNHCDKLKNFLKIQKKELRYIVENVTTERLRECMIFLILLSDDKIKKMAEEKNNFMINLHKLKILRDAYKHSTRNTTEFLEIKNLMYDFLYFFEVFFDFKLHFQSPIEFSENNEDEYYDSTKSYCKIKTMELFGVYYYDEKFDKIIDKIENIYENYLLNDSAYLTNLAPIVEETYKQLLKNLLKSYPIDESDEINENEIVDILTLNKFNYKIFKVEGPVFLKSFQQNKKYDSINKYLPSNVNYLLVNIISKYPEISAKLPKDMFVNMSTLMYFNKGHKQEIVFNEEVANILINDCLKTVIHIIKENYDG